MTRVLGPETADRESDADERYLADAGRRPARPRLPGPAGLAPRSRSRRRAGRPPAPRPGRPAGRRLARPRHGSRPAAGPDGRPGPAPARSADADRPAGSGGAQGGGNFTFFFLLAENRSLDSQGRGEALDLLGGPMGEEPDGDTAARIWRMASAEAGPGEGRRGPFRPSGSRPGLPRGRRLGLASPGRGPRGRRWSGGRRST